MALKCKKFITTTLTDPLKKVYEDLSDKELLPNDGAILEIQYAGVCHSDIHVKNSDFGNPKEYHNRVLGHEITGKIIKIGELVKTFKVNDDVIVYSWAACRKCKFCQSGNSPLCSNNVFSKNDIGLGHLGGGFSTHLILPDAEKYLIKRSPNIDAKVAPLLSCSALTAYNAVKTIGPRIKYIENINNNFSADKVSSEILLIGAGGLGQWAISFCKYFYPKSTLTVADISKQKLNMIKTEYKDKVDHTIQFSSQSSEDDMIELLNGKQMDAVIDFVGTSETSSMAVKVLNRGGILLIIGLLGGVMQSISATNINMIHSYLTIKGVRTATLEIMKEMVNLMETFPDVIKGPEIKLYKLEDVNLALEDLNAGKILGRAVLEIKKV